MVDIEVVKKIRLFDGLEERDIKKIAEVVKEIKVPADTLLFEEGDAGDAFYLLQLGKVVVQRKGAADVFISESDESNFFGEMALVEGAPRNATLKSVTPCELLEIDKVNFEMLLRLNSFIALRIMTVLTKRIRKTTAVMQAIKPEELKCGKIITFFSPKGGTGKSITAANLVSGVAKLTDKKALLIDLDLQFGDLAFMLGVELKHTIVDLVESDFSTGEDLQKFVAKHPNGFDVLPSPLKAEQSEIVTSTHLRKIIKIAQRLYDYIVLDTHSLFHDLTINALDISDLICLIMTPEMNHIKSMLMCMKVIENLNYPKEKIRLILNREESQYSMSRGDIEANLKRKFDFMLHDDWKHSLAMVNKQQTIFDSSDESKYRNDFIELLSGLTGEKIEAGAESSSNGLIGTLKNWLNG